MLILVDCSRGGECSCVGRPAQHQECRSVTADSTLGGTKGQCVHTPPTRSLRTRVDRTIWGFGTAALPQWELHWQSDGLLVWSEGMCDPTTLKLFMILYSFYAQHSHGSCLTTYRLSGDPIFVGEKYLIWKYMGY